MSAIRSTVTNVGGLADYKKGDVIKVDTDRQYFVGADGGTGWAWLQTSGLYKITSATPTTLDVVEYRSDRQVLLWMRAVLLAKFGTLANLALLLAWL